MAMKIPNYEMARLKRYLMRGQLQVIHGAGAPTDAVTGAATLKPSGLYVNTSDDKVYMNVGSLASPRYTIIN